MEIKSTEKLTPIGTFKCYIPEEYYVQRWYVEPKQEGTLFFDENGNMIAGLTLYIAPVGRWDEGGAELNAILVIKEEDIYEIDLDSEEAKRHVKYYKEDH